MHARTHARKLFDTQTSGWSRYLCELLEDSGEHGGLDEHYLDDTEALHQLVHLPQLQRDRSRKSLKVEHANWATRRGGGAEAGNAGPHTSSALQPTRTVSRRFFQGLASRRSLFVALLVLRPAMRRDAGHTRVIESLLAVRRSRSVMAANPWAPRPPPLPPPLPP